MTKILVVDNYDSFVFNLVQYLQQLGAEVVVKRNDEVNAESINGFDGVLLSPGPGTPEDAGACIEIVNAAIETPSVPEELLVTATTDTGVIMGVKHKSAPIEGVQFHPESVLTEGGHRLLANWLKSTNPNESKKIEDFLQQIVKF